MSFLGFARKKPALDLSYSVINEDHTHLIQLAAELRCTALKGVGDTPTAQAEKQAQVEDLVYRLIADSIEHFSREEVLMQAYNYPGYRLHRQEHEQLSRKATAYYNDLTEGRIAITEDLANFYRRWLHDHIRSHDKDLERFLFGRRS